MVKLLKMSNVIPTCMFAIEGLSFHRAAILPHTVRTILSETSFHTTAVLS